MAYHTHEQSTMTAKYYTANKAGEESLKGKLVFELDLER
jgi:hypothetical protein